MTSDCKAADIVQQATICSNKPPRHHGMTLRHKALVAASLVALVLACVGMFLPINAALIDLGGNYIVGFLFCLGAHEVFSWATGQPSETCRYLLAVNLKHTLESSRPSSEAGPLANVWMARTCKGVVWLTFGAVSAGAILGLLYQRDTPSTPSSALALIIGAAAAGEVLLPCIARIQAPRILRLVRSIARERRLKEQAAASARLPRATQEKAMSDEAFPFTRPPRRA